jgi:hypothetical protein
LSKKNTHIDDLFKENLKGASLPTSDLDWAAIEKGLNKSPRKKPVLWAWIVVGLSFAGLLSYVIWPKNKALTKHENQIVAPTTKTQDELGKNTSKTQELKTSPLSDEKEERSSRSSTDFLAENTNKRSGEASNAKKGTSDQINPISKQEPLKGVTGDNDASKNTKEQGSRLFDNIQVQQKSISGLAFNIFDQPQPVLNLTPSLKWPIPSPMSSPWYVGLDAGMLRAVKETQVEKAELQTFQDRSNSELPQWSFSYGMQAGFQWNRFQLHSGIQSSKVQFENPSFTYTTYDSFPVLNPRGEVIGYGRFNYRDTTTTNQRNSISTLSIPLQVNYQVFETAKFALSLGVQGNALFNVGQSGYSLNTDLLRVPFASRYSNILNLQLGANAFARYQLTQHLFVGLQASYLRQANNLEIRSGYSTKLHQLSLKSGLYYAF